MDAALDQEFPEEEATRVLKVGLLCVQETASLRPLMSAVVKMLTDATSMKNVSISKPGHLPDLMHLKVGHNHSPCSSDAYSNSSTFN